MREFEKGNQKFIEVDGQHVPYDGVVKIYVDSTTGNWVVSTPYRPETMFDLLSDAVEHFLDVASKENVDDEILVPEITKSDLILMPMPSTEWN